MKPVRDFSSMSEAEIAAADTSEWIAVLPLGAHEQHGKHLPFDTDTIIAGGIADRLASSMETSFPVTFLPVEPVGYSIEHMDFEGSRSLSFDEAINRWIAMGEALAGLGIRKLLILNAHGGNSPLMTIVSTELRVRCSMLCVATSWTRFLTPYGKVNEAEKAFGIHGGMIETSVMLALSPAKVEMQHAGDFSSFQQDLVRDAYRLRAYGPHAFGWKMQDLNQSGVTGNARDADAETGERLIGQAITGLGELLEDMRNFDLSRFKG